MYPEDGSDAEQLLSEADRRMYIAKHRDKQDVSPRGFAFDSLSASALY